MHLQQLGDNLQRRKEYIIIDERFRTEIEKFMDAQYTNSDVFKLIEAVSQEDVIQQHLGIIGIRKLLSVERNSPIQSIIDAGIIPRLICLTDQSQYPQLQFQGLWCLTNIASGTTAQCRSVIEKGAISLFIRLIKSNNAHIAEQAVWVLGNIASDCISFRNQIILEGGGQILAEHLRNLTDSKAVNNCCWAISNLCRQISIPPYQVIRELIITLCQTLSKKLITDKQSISDCCWAISFSSDSQEKQQVILKSNVLPQLVELLQEEQLNILVPSLKILQDLSQRQEAIVQLFSLNIVQYIEKLIQYNKRTIRLCVCSILSNISANKQQAEAIMRSQKLLKSALNIFANELDELVIFFSKLVDKIHSMQFYILLKSSPIVNNILRICSTRKRYPQKIQNVLKLLYQLIILQQKYCQKDQMVFATQLMTNASKLQILNVSHWQKILNSLKLIQVYLDR